MWLKSKPMDHEKEWWELHRRAYRVLEQSDILPQRTSVARGFTPCFRLWRHPSFEAHFAWHVYRSDDAAQFGIERIFWDFPADRARFAPLEGVKHGFHSEPTFRREIIYVESKILLPACQQLQRLRLSPFLPAAMACLDGETRGVAVGGFYDQMRVSWWGDGPTEWRALTLWFAHTTTLLESHFATS